MIMCLTAEKKETFFNGAITKLGTHLCGVQWLNSFTVQFIPNPTLYESGNLQSKTLLHKSLWEKHVSV